MTGSNADKLRDLGIYLVTDPLLVGERGVEQTVAAAVDAGVAAVQLRDKEADDDALLRQAERLAEIIAGRALFLVNDRLDVVLRARRAGLPVDGVHLGQDDTPVDKARAALGPEAVIGWSADRPEHLDQLRRLPEGTVDYLGVGAVHPTQTKADHPEAVGIEGFGRFARQAGLPCVAIGGITQDDVPELKTVGASGAAVVSAICAAADPYSAASDLVSAWRGDSD